jgi:hypothetical protein
MFTVLLHTHRSWKLGDVEVEYALSLSCSQFQRISLSRFSTFFVHADMHVGYTPVRRNTMHCLPSRTSPSTINSPATMPFKYPLVVVLCIAIPLHQHISKTHNHRSYPKPTFDDTIRASLHQSQHDVPTLLQPEHFPQPPTRQVPP